MAGLKQIEMELEGTKDLVLIDSQDGVWLVVPIRWWDLATLLWWLLCPTDKKSKVKITLFDNKKVSFRAVRVASRYIRVRGTVK